MSEELITIKHASAVTAEAIQSATGEMCQIIAVVARNMADDIERQSLPTTGPQALRRLADLLTREGERK